MTKDIDQELMKRLRNPTLAMIRAGRAVVEADPLWKMADAFTAMVEEAINGIPEEEPSREPVSAGHPTLYHRPPA